MKLIIINGPFGAGKSTTAYKLHEAMPLSLLIEIDVHRRFISQYKKHKRESYNFVMKLAISQIETSLRNNHDVIVERSFTNKRKLEEIISIGKKYKAEIYEFILWAPKDTIMDRVIGRGLDPESLLTKEMCRKTWHKLKEFKEERPNATIIDSSSSTPREILKKIQKVIF